jgi:hypothetical protein
MPYKNEQDRYDNRKLKRKAKQKPHDLVTCSSCGTTAHIFSPNKYKHKPDCEFA